jgi:hypothetical protein
MLKALTLVAVASTLVFASQTATAQYGRGPARVAQKTDKPKSTILFVVVQIDGDYQVVEKAKVKEVEKSLREAFKDETKQWNEAKKQAAKEKQKFTDPKPVMKKVKIHSATFKSEEDAGKYIEKEVEKASKGKK